MSVKQIKDNLSYQDWSSAYRLAGFVDIEKTQEFNVGVDVMETNDQMRLIKAYPHHGNKYYNSRIMEFRIKKARISQMVAGSSIESFSLIKDKG